MVKFVKLDESFMTPQEKIEYYRISKLNACGSGTLAQLQVEKLRTDSEAAITELEVRYENLDAICERAASTIVHLTEHSIILEKSCQKAAEIIIELTDSNDDLGKAYDIMEEVVQEIKKKYDDLENSKKDLEDRVSQFEDVYDEDMKKLDASNMLMSSMCFIGLVALGMIFVFFSM